MSPIRSGPGPAGGQRFGRTDLDRLGLFQDMVTSPFDPYPKSGPLFRAGAEKGRQMLAGPSSALFTKGHQRIFEGEALPRKPEATARSTAKRAQGVLLPPSPSKKHSTPGDYHGCFEKISYFSPQRRPELPRERPKPNAKIGPNPRGGPGYVAICLNRYPTHSNEPYDTYVARKGGQTYAPRFLTASAAQHQFPPNPYLDPSPGPTYVRPEESKPKMIGPGRICVPFPKRPGGNHDGCFEKYPSHSTDPYLAERKKAERLGPFLAGGPTYRSMYTCSILERITRRSCHAGNYIAYTERAYPVRET